MVIVAKNKFKGNVNFIPAITNKPNNYFAFRSMQDASKYIHLNTSGDLDENFYHFELSDGFFNCCLFDELSDVDMLTELINKKYDAHYHFYEMVEKGSGIATEEILQRNNFKQTSPAC